MKRTPRFFLVSSPATGTVLTINVSLGGGTFEPPYSALLHNLVDNFNVELQDIDDAIFVGASYLKNPDSFVQLNAMRSEVQQMIAAAQQALVDEGYVSNPSGYQMGSAFNSASCVAAAMANHWWKAAFDMLYVEMHLTQVDTPMGIQRVPLTDPDPLDQVLSAFPSLDALWQQIGRRFNYNLTGPPSTITGGVAGTQSPNMPYQAVAEVLQSGFAALQGDITRTLGINSAYAKNPDTAAQLHTMQRLAGSLSQRISQMYTDEGFLVGYDGNYDVRVTSSAVCVCLRVSYRWFLQARDLTHIVTQIYEASQDPTPPLAFTLGNDTGSGKGNSAERQVYYQWCPEMAWGGFPNGSSLGPPTHVPLYQTWLKTKACSGN
jgi:hypothetical protein